MRRFLVSVFVVSVLVAADGAEAQQWRPERPYRGLFAGNIGETSQLLTATASVGTGWDENLVPNLVGSDFTPGSRQLRSAVGTASTFLSYSLNAGRVEFGATAGTTGRYYPSLSSGFVRRDYANLGMAVPLGGGFLLRGAAGYQPYSLRSMFPALFEMRLGEPMIPDEDFPASHVHYFSYSGGVDYAHRISRRTTFSAAYDYQARTGSGVTGRYERQSVRGRLTRDVGKGLAVYAGYGYSEARYGEPSRPLIHHDIDLGVSYNRALSLSLSRRTLISFSTGTAAYRQGVNAKLRYNATGTARLSHEMGRTWNASLAYNRGLSFVETWQEPVFADSLMAGMAGGLGRRTQLQFAARALRGGGSSGRYGDAESVSGSGGLTVALSRHVNTGLTYVYYRHRFVGTLALAEGFPSDFEGQSIRATVTVWAPLFQRARRP